MMAKLDKSDPLEAITSPAKGDFIAPPEIADVDERTDALPQQEEFWKPPTCFGSVPVEKEPLGWDRRRRGFRKLSDRTAVEVKASSIVLPQDLKELKALREEKN